MSHRWVHYPSLPPSFQETKQQVQHTPVTTLLQQIVHKVIFNWRKMKRTNSVKCPVLHMNVLHCSIPTASPGRWWQRVREQWQWNAFARLLLDAKPVTCLEVIRQSECKEGHMTVENCYTSKCMSTKSWQQRRKWILRPTAEAEQSA